MSQYNLKINEAIFIEDTPASPQTTNKTKSLEGVVAYLGPVSFADGEDWVGVRLTGGSIGLGKNDGTVRGKRYFNGCGFRDGIFVRRGRVRARAMNRLEELRLKKELVELSFKREMIRSRSRSNSQTRSFNDDNESMHSRSSSISKGKNRSRSADIQKRCGKSSSSSSSGSGAPPRSSRPIKSSTNDTTKQLRTMNEKMQEKIEYLTGQVRSKEEENIYLQQSLHTAEQRAHNTNVALTTSTKTALTSITKDLTAESNRPADQKKEIKDSSACLQAESAALGQRMEDLVGENEEMTVDKENMKKQLDCVEKRLKEVELDRESVKIEADKLMLELEGVRERANISEGGGGDGGTTVSSETTDGELMEALLCIGTPGKSSKEDQKRQIKCKLEKLMDLDADMNQFIHEYTGDLLQKNTPEDKTLQGQLVAQLRKALEDKSNLAFDSVFEKNIQQGIALEYCNASKRAVAVFEEERILKEEWVNGIDEKKSLLAKVSKNIDAEWWEKEKIQKLQNEGNQVEKALHTIKETAAQSSEQYAELKNIARPLIVPTIAQDFEKYNEMFGKVLDTEKGYILSLEKLSNNIQHQIDFKREKENRNVGKLSQSTDGVMHKCSLDFFTFLCSSALLCLDNDMPIMLKHLSEATGGKVMIGPLKSISRTFQKVKEDNRGDFSRVLDLCRASLIYKDVKTIYKALEYLWKLHGEKSICIERIKPRICYDNKKIVNSGGYRDVLINVRLLDASDKRVQDHICEIQLHLEQFIEYKGHSGHTTYEMVRTLKLMDPQASAPLIVECTPLSLEPLRNGQISILDLSGITIGVDEAQILQEVLGGNSAHVVAAMLKKVFLDGCSLTDESCAAIAMGMKEHVHLHTLSICSNKQITDEGASSLIRLFPRLQCLYLKDLPKVTDVSLIIACNSCTLLEEIDLRHSPSFTDKGVSHIPRYLQCLSKFGIDESLKLQEKTICRLLEGSPRLVEYDLGNLICRLFEFHSPPQDEKIMEDQKFKEVLERKLETSSSFKGGRSNFPTSIKHKNVDRKEINLEALLNGKLVQGDELTGGTIGEEEWEVLCRTTFQITSYNPETHDIEAKCEIETVMRLVNGNPIPEKAKSYSLKQWITAPYDLLLEIYTGKFIPEHALIIMMGTQASSYVKTNSSMHRRFRLGKITPGRIISTHIDFGKQMNLGTGLIRSCNATDTKACMTLFEDPDAFFKTDTMKPLFYVDWNAGL